MDYYICERGILGISAIRQRQSKGASYLQKKSQPANDATLHTKVCSDSVKSDPTT